MTGKKSTKSKRILSSRSSNEEVRAAVLTILLEECAEVIQQAGKSLRFGMDEVQPGQPYSNKIRLSHALGGLTTVIDCAIAAGLISAASFEDGAGLKGREILQYMQSDFPK